MQRGQRHGGVREHCRSLSWESNMVRQIRPLTQYICAIGDGVAEGAEEPITGGPCEPHTARRGDI